VRLVESDPALVAQLKLIQARLAMEAVQVVRGDGVVALRQAAAGSLDAVFLDPPFDSGLFETAVYAAGLAVAATGFVYLEAPVLWRDERLQAANLQVHRYLKAGAVHAHLLKRIA
jgi:16S rRNA G966 N2-methylase RsmD